MRYRAWVAHRSLFHRHRLHRLHWVVGHAEPVSRDTAGRRAGARSGRQRRRASPSRAPAGRCLPPQWWISSTGSTTRPGCRARNPHTTETVFAFSLPEPTIAEAEKALNFCDRHVRSYLGVDPESWVPWSPVAFLPSKEEVAAGASWVRCDAFFPATTHHSSARTTNVSAKGIADAPPADFWACTDKPPDGADQPFVPCDRPHNYEQTGSLAILDQHHRVPVRGRTFGRGSATVSRRASRPATTTSPSMLYGIPAQPSRRARSSQAGASCSTPMGGRCLPGRGSMMVGR